MATRNRTLSLHKILPSLHHKVYQMAGGFVPFASHRFAQLAHVFRPDAAKPADILASFQRFYFDTALSSSPAAATSKRRLAMAMRGPYFPA
jgi:hypothetical protein